MGAGGRMLSCRQCRHISCWLLAACRDSSYPARSSSIALIGFAAGVEYDLMAFLVARYFGMRAYASIYGELYGCLRLGAGVGPLVFGMQFDKFHSYRADAADLGR